MDASQKGGWIGLNFFAILFFATEFSFEGVRKFLKRDAECYRKIEECLVSFDGVVLSLKESWRGEWVK